MRPSGSRQQSSCLRSRGSAIVSCSQFQDYDDEGYLLLTVQQFVRGLPLYDEVYTQYGPAYYLWQQVLHTLLGIPVTHDATRVVTVVVWLVCAALVGATVWLLTRRPLFTVIGTVAAFLHLTQLTYEPGHPQELCLLGVLAPSSHHVATGRERRLASSPRWVSGFCCRSPRSAS